MTKKLYVINYDDWDMEEKEKWEYNNEPFFVLSHSESYDDEKIQQFVDKAIEYMLSTQKKSDAMFNEIKQCLIEKFGFEEIRTNNCNITEKLLEASKEMNEF